MLLLGSGGREHAFALGLAADPAVSALVAAPGNPGIGEVARLRPDLTTTDPDAVAAAAVELAADLVVVGPEAPLVAGVADAVRGKGIPCFGPGAAAARLEGSKAFAKEVMAAAGVPTARSRTCPDPDAAGAALDAFGPPYVVKHDGLAAGKGVVVTPDRAAALAHAAAASGPVVVEEYLAGPEVSLFVLCDGAGGAGGSGGTAVPLLPAQDFKRVGDGDTGPNTGGMGAYAPLPWAPPDLVDRVMAAVVRPTLGELARRGTPYTGVLYVGLALTARGPAVVEFNCRLGDPEAQVELALLATPLGGLLYAAATGALAGHPPLRWRPGAAVTVVIAAPGYPASPRTGGVLTVPPVPSGHSGAPRAPGAPPPVSGVLHAGTARRAGDGALVSAGGRVVSCTATGADLAAARDAAYALVAGVGLAGAQYRSDIARAAVDGHVALPR